MSEETQLDVSALVAFAAEVDKVTDAVMNAVDGKSLSTGMAGINMAVLNILDGVDDTVIRNEIAAKFIVVLEHFLKGEDL